MFSAERQSARTEAKMVNHIYSVSSSYLERRTNKRTSTSTVGNTLRRPSAIGMGHSNRKFERFTPILKCLQWWGRLPMKATVFCVCSLHLVALNATMLIRLFKAHPSIPRGFKGAAFEIYCLFPFGNDVLVHCICTRQPMLPTTLFASYCVCLCCHLLMNHVFSCAEHKTEAMARNLRFWIVISAHFSCLFPWELKNFMMKTHGWPY